MTQSRANLVAHAEIDISAAPPQVWRALTDPEVIAQYMFGSQVETDWQPGHPIVWRGEYEGKPYEDKGSIVAVEEDRRLELTHYSPMGGQPDESENYHILVYELQARGSVTHLSLSQDNNADEQEVARSTDTWQTMLSGLKETVEKM